ncbi:hypothetical protein CHARACLAT_023854 [Characodon lateralis]|uniref:Uncharacterized protein n=1 Tax=Characodon lateralis TaxID=208331 RepID=A0ABU7ELW2_9TELE|nr:hypothetical protein [Characodon lateralis]
MQTVWLTEVLSVAAGFGLFMESADSQMNTDQSAHLAGTRPKAFVFTISHTIGYGVYLGCTNCSFLADHRSLKSLGLPIPISFITDTVRCHKVTIHLQRSNSGLIIFYCTRADMTCWAGLSDSPPLRAEQKGTMADFFDLCGG